MKTLPELIHQQLTTTAAVSQRARDALAARLGSSLCGHVLFIRTEMHRVHVTVDSSAWATRLRFMEQEILSELGYNPGEGRVVVHVLPPGTRLPCARDSEREPPRASHRTANAIQRTAETIDDQQLRQSLEKLAAHLRGGSD